MPVRSTARPEAWVQAFGRVGIENTDHRASVGQISVAEIQALASADDLILSEQSAASAVSRCADDLRLPPPPRGVSGNGSIASSIELLVSRFEGSASPVGVPAEGLRAEATMLAVARGILGLQRQIREQITQAQRG